MEEKVAFTLDADLTGIPGKIQLLPAGEINPKGKASFIVDAAARAEILANHAKETNDLVIDYEHQSLAGSQAPAAGWVKELEDRGDGAVGGIWGRVEWTTRASEYLKNREYRYLSPVIRFKTATRRAFELCGAGLTNLPAIDGMVPVVNKSGGLADTGTGNGDMAVKIKGLLGLTEAATDAEVLDGLGTLRDAIDAIIKALGLPEGSSTAEIKAKMLALKMGEETGEALSAQLREREVDGAVQEALKTGKITPAQSDDARRFAMLDIEAFRAFYKAAPPVIPTGSLAGNEHVRRGGGDDVQRSINKTMGVSEETFKKYNA